MDRRRLHPGHGRSDAVGRQPQRPLWSAWFSQCRARAVCDHLRSSRAGRHGGRPDLGTRRDGRRRRGDLPGHPGADHEHLHRPGTARQGDRPVGRHGRRRRGRRTHHWRLAARKLLVGFYFPGQRADRGSGDRRRAAVRPDVAGSRGPARRRTGPGPVRDRRDRPGVHHHRSAQRGMDQRPTPSPGSSSPPSSSPRSRCGSCAHPIRCSTCRCSRTAGSPAAAWR